MPLPELIEIVPLDQPVRAEITVPGSKSITNRALILAALADGEVTLEGALWSEDTQIMVECLQELGFMVDVRPDPNEFCNRTITVYGKGGQVPPGGTESQPIELFVGNAGTAARFLSAFVCLGKGVYRLHGVDRMHERPQAALFKALRELGYRVEAEQGNDKLPVRIFGGDGRADLPVRQEARQRLPTTRSCTVSIEESSQFASALLLCAKIGGWQVEVTGENAEESAYVVMTSKLIEVFPHRGGRFEVEPDASSASYFHGAAILLPNADIAVLQTITGWQIDEAFPTVFREALSGKPASRSRNIGDSMMTAIVLGAYLGKVQLRFTDLGRLRVQETERVRALFDELTKCGSKVIEEGDSLIVLPSKLHEPRNRDGSPGFVETYDDHRMAMCFAILGLKVPGIKIKNPACVKKTFPNFFQKLAAPPPRGLGAEIRDARTRQKLTEAELFAD